MTLKGHAPKNPLLSPRFGDIATFGRLPHTRNLKGVNVAVLGIPFDGAATYRAGARLGPRGIRNASVLNRNVHPLYNVHIYEKLSAIDYGDVNVNPINIQATFSEVEKEYDKLLKAGVLPIAMGGDHSVLLPILRSMKKKYRHFGIVHFDAHTDTADQAWGEKYHHGTPIRRAIEEKLVAGKDIFQIGLRGPLTSKSQMDWDREQGIQQLGIDEINAGRLADFIREIRNRNIPLYLTFDIDSIDPAFAPGTGTPVVGGLTSAQALDMLRKLAGLRFIGFDCMEVAPAYDVSEITSLLASAILFECMSLAAVERGLSD